MRHQEIPNIVVRRIYHRRMDNGADRRREAPCHAHLLEAALPLVCPHPRQFPPLLSRQLGLDQLADRGRPLYA